MYISRLELINYRNIEHQVIEPSKGVNLIYGDNAQGKTNILESIWLFTGCRSFRSPRDCEVIGLGKPGAKMIMDYYGFDREQNLTLEISGKRTITHNGVKTKRRADIIGNFTAVVFSPVHLSLIKGGPAERRRFLNIAIGQQSRGYTENLMQYQRAVENRNILLRNAAFRNDSGAMIDVWDDGLSKFGGRIIYDRIKYLEHFRNEAADIYRGISDEREEMTVKYKTQVTEFETQDEITRQLAEKLAENRDADIASGMTSVGPHRDDLSVRLNGNSARVYGSQGQQRSCALSLKLAEASMVHRMSGEEPVVLLDDVMSELDVSRQKYILNHLADRQVFITCCDTSALKYLDCGRTFEISSGKIIDTDNYNYNQNQ